MNIPTKEQLDRLRKKNAIKRRHSRAGNRGRKVTKDIFFLPHMGQTFPSESRELREQERIEYDLSEPRSWPWAFYKCMMDGLWLVVPIEEAMREKYDAEEVRRAVVRTRASAFRSAGRLDIPLISEYIEPNLYIAITEPEKDDA